MNIKEKNIAKGTIQDFLVGEGIIVLKISNDLEDNKKFNYDINKNYIQFHFCLKGSCKFLFNNGSYSFPIDNGSSIMLYNPQQELPIDAFLYPGSLVLSVLISIKEFHGLFSNQADQISFLNKDNIDNKFYKEIKDVLIFPTQVITLSSHFALSTKKRVLLQMN